MPGKILFFEDEINQEGNMIFNALKKSGCIPPKPPKGEDYRPTWDCESFNADFKDYAIELVGTSFDEAIKKINKIGNATNYNLIFVDRNLENFSDVKDKEENVGGEKFLHSFYDFFNGFIGDYIYFRLIQNGIPPEKIYILTANSTKENEFKAAPFVQINEAMIIDKGKNSSNNLRFTDDDRSGNEQKNDCKAVSSLEKILSDRGKATITRNRYKDIFNSEKIEQLFGKTDLLKNFLNLLTEMRLGKKISIDAGQTLRLMIEKIIQAIAPGEIEKSVRMILNQSDYMDKLNVSGKNKKIIDAFKKYLDQRHGFATESDTSNQYSKFVEFSTNLTLTYFDLVFSSRSYSNQQIPKYIYSYIDNIYTTTSECSMHGKSDDTRDLSNEGWYSLLNGMCQILNWYQASWEQNTQTASSATGGQCNPIRSGKIKSIKKDGYGFLDNDLYFNKSDLMDIPFDDLKVGIVLEYELGENTKGPCAKKIHRKSNPQLVE